MKKTILILSTSIMLFNCGSEETPKVDKNIEKIVAPTKNIITNDSTITEHTVDSTITANETNTITQVKIIDKVIVKTDDNITTTVNTNQNVVIEKKDTTLVIVKAEIKEVIEETPKDLIFNHQEWDALLRKNVSSSGTVNYKGFVADKSRLNKYISKLKAEYTNLTSWSKNKQLAYWINLYNAFTVKLITDNYPTSSITKLNGGKPWDKRFIKLGSKTYTLNEVENDIIRKRYNERRIHFAVNCAAKSCPNIMNQAFTENNLNRKLSKMTKLFLKDKSKNILSAEKVQISKIFKWYQEDFSKDGNIIPFLQKYSDIEINDDAKVEYLEYSWDLNE